MENLKKSRNSKANEEILNILGMYAPIHMPCQCAYFQTVLNTFPKNTIHLHIHKKFIQIQKENMRIKYTISAIFSKLNFSIQNILLFFHLNFLLQRISIKCKGKMELIRFALQPDFVVAFGAFSLRQTQLENT